MSMQSGWRWCQKCQGLVFAGNPSPGPCPAGGQHDGGQSGAYAVQFDNPTMMEFHDGVSTQDWAPIGGWVNVVMNRDGRVTFSGHMHDSGFPNIDYTLAVLIMTPSGTGFRAV